ncbi:MAG TPA: PAS domain S-box protein, partial [Vicinamibacterales bacterium]|nr:PAS domain S-box protein [Vicinamibacterales bacterium]
VLTAKPLSESMNTGIVAVAGHLALGITRHRAEAARRLLASIVTSTEDAIFATTLDGTIVSWNGGAERLYGYSAEEAIGKPVSITYPTGHSAEFAETLRCLFAGDPVVRRETVRRRKDGTEVAVAKTMSPIRDASGRLIGKSVIARDITDRQRAERTVRESQERFRLIAETVTQVFWIADAPIGSITYVSPAYERIWGRSCGSLYADPQSFVEAIQADDRVQALATLTAQQRGESFDHEYRIVRPDGQVRWIWDRGFPVPMPDGGGVVQYVGVAEDITDRKSAEQSLRDAEERMRFALDASGVGVWEANLRTGVAYWSETCERMHGIAPGSFGRTMEAFLSRIHPEDRERIGALIGRAIAERRDAELEYHTQLPDGTMRLISSVGRFRYDENGSPVRGAGVALDITERRSLEDQLRQAQKMEAIGQLAGGIAHDFNNLLTAILGFSEFLAESFPEDDARRQDVDEVRHAAERAATLTKQLLAFGRKQILDVRIMHVGDVVAELTPMLRRLVSEAIDLRTTTGDRGLVKADPGQLQQVLMNLVVNARDAMPDGGRLTIETCDLMIDDAFVRRHPGAPRGPHVALHVRDTGSGMDAVTLKRIFEPFFTTKPKGQGTGLGLATVYGIVKQSGGAIWVESEPGRGTSFTVCLPRTDEVDVPAEAAQVDAPSGRGEETVLLVEDENVVREFVYKVLTRKGYTVHALPDPQRAIEYAEAHHARIDLVFTDVVLPDMNGKAMVTRLRTRHPESKVLFMSGYDDNAIVQHGVLNMDTELLQKPFTADALARKVRGVLDA